MTSDEAPGDFWLRFWTAPHPELGVVAWARHPTAGTIRETLVPGGLVALRARWAIEDAGVTSELKPLARKSHRPTRTLVNMTSWVDELARCPLAAGPFPADARRCDWCGNGLEGRRRRWCSDECSFAYSENHAWTNARAAAIRRDKVCQGCGSDGRTIGEAFYRVLLLICPRPTPPRLLAFCQSIGRYPDHEEARDAYRAHVRRQQAPWVHALELLDEHRRRHRLEVNHKVPCLGAHRENSCAHHLAGLEVLCHPCHLRVTARQRAAGLLRAG